jgi:predicted amidohydrolase YtcJ
VIASMQPTHATSDMPWAEARLGPERIGWAYTWRSLADAGAHLAFGSDFPVESHEPARGLWAATRRQDARGEPAGGWRADQVVTLDEAVAAFTTGAWAAEGRPDRGELTVGAPATLTVWEGSGDAVPGLHPVATYIDGAPRWRVPPTD